MATRTDLMLRDACGSEARRGRIGRVRSALVVAEIAASIVLLVGAALLARSLAALVDTNLGVNTENVLTAQSGSAGRGAP